MSTTNPLRRKTVRDIAQFKGKNNIVALTAYTAPVAATLDSHVDILLVGDSLAMVLYGEETTLQVDLDTMIRHGRAVTKASSQALVIVDMPFGSYQESPRQAYNNCARVLKETGCTAVKLEGGDEMIETVGFLSQRGIPVMAHIGLMPQHVHAMGGYRYQGREENEQAKLLKQALQLEEAGAFSLLLEGIDASLAERITRKVSVPTIGIGAGQQCDGQILVMEDMCGMSEHTPKFVKRYADMRQLVADAAEHYANDVRNGDFPDESHGYGKPSVTWHARKSTATS
jgi:3-methyl-2-oxobutanoate hydroxymethyltransferase